MRLLLIRLTSITAIAAALVSALIGILTRNTWTIVLIRSVVAMAIVVVAGAGVGMILMRTALRRYYEQGRSTSGDRHVRADR